MMKIVALIAMGVASADAVRVGDGRIQSAPLRQHEPKHDLEHEHIFSKNQSK